MVCGSLFVICAIAVPFIIDSLVRSHVQQSLVLSKDNQLRWTSLLTGGNDDIPIQQSHFLYECTNFEDVIFSGGKPEFEEVGPFVYREVNRYEDVQYGGEERSRDSLMSLD